jgi:aminopeptidase N
MKIRLHFFILPITFCFTVTANTQVRFDESNLTSISEAEQKAHQPLLLKGAEGKGLSQTNASTNFNIHFYRCQWKINPEVRFISGSVTSYFTITSLTNTLTFDLSDTLNVDSVLYHGQKITSSRNLNDALEIQFPATIGNNIVDSVTIFYHGTPRTKAGFGAFTKSSHSGVPIIWTLSEPYGSKEWWPCKNGLDDKADSIDISITSPLQYRGSSNGLQVAEDSTVLERTVFFKHRYPIASYLVCAAVTNYQIVRDEVLIDGKNMPLLLTTYPEWVANADRINERTKKAFALLNPVFGNYPFAQEQYAHTAWSWGGGMEHQTNSFIATTDEELLTHELAHQWFGDWITCGSWKDIWLNEGFATYSWLMYIEKYYPHQLIPYLKYYTNIITARNDGSVIVDDTSSVSRIFSGRLTYTKGAYVVAMLRWALGDEAFFKGTRQYLNDNNLKKGFALTADLQRNMEQASGRSLQSFVQKWLYKQGFPNYNAEWFTNNNGWIRVQLNQSTSHPSVNFYEMPVQLTFKNSSKDTTFTVNHTESGQTFWLNPGFMPDTLMIDPNYKVLAKERISKKINAATTKTNDVKIYPNPAPQQVSIAISNPDFSTLNISLVNSVGQKVYANSVSSNGSDFSFQIPTAILAKGIYYLKIDNAKDLRKTYEIIH